MEPVQAALSARTWPGTLLGLAPAPTSVRHVAVVVSLLCPVATALPHPALFQCTPSPFNSHNFTHTVGETANVSLVQGGVDYNLGDFYRVWLYGSLLNGSVSEADVDVAVSRV